MRNHTSAEKNESLTVGEFVKNGGLVSVASWIVTASFVGAALRSTDPDKLVVGKAAATVAVFSGLYALRDAKGLTWGDMQPKSLGDKLYFLANATATGAVAGGAVGALGVATQMVSTTVPMPGK